MEIMKVVDEFHKEIDFDAHKSCDAKHSTANNCIECCSNPYFEQIEIDYSCPQKRKIYVARYAPAYISEIFHALSATKRDHSEELFNKPEINVASIGGGPGTDVAAFKKWLSNYMEDHHKVEKVNFLRVDINEDWSDVSKDIVNLYNHKDVNFEFKKIVQDVTERPIKSKSFDYFDVILLSYVISEINGKDVDRMAAHISALISDKALVVVNDRPEQGVIDKIDHFIEEMGGKSPRVIEPRSREHCGETYLEKIYDDVKPRIFRNSIRYNILIGS